MLIDELIQGVKGNAALASDEETEQSLLLGCTTHERYYDPVVGRFISEDPIRHNSGDDNLFRYARNDPINNVDPSGQLTLSDALIAGQGVIYAGDVGKLQLTSAEVDAINQSVTPGIGGVGPTWTAAEIAAGTTYWGAQAKQDADTEMPGILPPARYRIKALELNTERAKLILLFRSPGFADYTRELYKFLRGVNPVHFVAEESFALGQGYEPVLGEKADRLKTLEGLLLYFAFLKGGEIAGKALGNIKQYYIADNAPYAGVEFTSGGRLNVMEGYKPDLDEAEAAVALAENGENITLKPAVGPGSGEGGTSDAYVLRNGKQEVFDIKTPTSPNQNKVFSYSIRSVNSQARGVILDLRKTTVQLEDLGNIMARLQGSGGTNIQEVIVIQQNGTIVHLLRIPK